MLHLGLLASGHQTARRGSYYNDWLRQLLQFSWLQSDECER